MRGNRNNTRVGVTPLHAHKYTLKNRNTHPASHLINSPRAKPIRGDSIGCLNIKQTCKNMLATTVRCAAHTKKTILQEHARGDLSAAQHIRTKIILQEHARGDLSAAQHMRKDKYCKNMLAATCPQRSTYEKDNIARTCSQRQIRSASTYEKNHTC